LREAVALGIDHIDTADFYGTHITNQIIREALFQSGFANAKIVCVQNHYNLVHRKDDNPSRNVTASTANDRRSQRDLRKRLDSR
jgi:aryl-alcohol dehydrogenase-like predicted oxidoreductase